VAVEGKQQKEIFMVSCHSRIVAGILLVALPSMMCGGLAPRCFSPVPRASHDPGAADALCEGRIDVADHDDTV
jgi:hypothetical protein